MISWRRLTFLTLPLLLSALSWGGDIERTATSTVAVANLNIPSKARKEYHRASVAIQKEDWSKAKELLIKVLAIHPNYAAAYNDLGVVYARLGDAIHEREALQQAVLVDDHFAPAYVNLAKLSVADHNFPEAERMLSSAVAAEPTNPQNLMLLANVELLAGHFAAAITHCRKVHALPHAAQALAHYIAARALQHENKPAAALVEFQNFLDEEPAGPDTETARREMAALENNFAGRVTAEDNAAPLPSH
jgi:Flp pilus assembly protein TadD